MILKNDAKFEEKTISCFKNDKNLIRALKSLKNLHFDWCLLCKVYRRATPPYFYGFPYFLKSCDEFRFFPKFCECYFLFPSWFISCLLSLNQ